MFPGPPPTDARNEGPTPHHKEDPDPTDHIRPLLGAALSVDPATVAASPSRPFLPTDRKPGGSSRLSPATRRRPASVTATDGKPPAPPYRGRGTNPRLARGVREPPASLHPAWWTGPSAPSHQTARATTAPRGPAPPRPYKSKHAAPRSKSLAKAASPTRGEAKGHQPGEGRRTLRSCTADAARKREDGQPRQRSSSRSSTPSGAGLSRGAPQGAMRGEARTRRTETAGSERRRTDARAANSACPPLGAARKGGEGRASPFPPLGKLKEGTRPMG